MCIRDRSEGAFEQRFAQRESTLESFAGFRGFQLLRRDGKDPDGFTHSTWSVWDDQASFDAWRASEKPKPPPAAGAAAAGPPAGKPDIFVRRPVPTFYEGILTLQSADGV
eukprot:5984167-Prymnesium_polylepis.1